MVDGNSESIEAQDVVLDVYGNASNISKKTDIKDSVPLLKKVSLLNSTFLLCTKLIQISYFS